MWALRKEGDSRIEVARGFSAAALLPAE